MRRQPQFLSDGWYRAAGTVVALVFVSGFVICVVGAIDAMRGWNWLVSIHGRNPDSTADRIEGFLMFMLFSAGFLWLAVCLARDLWKR